MEQLGNFFNLQGIAHLIATNLMEAVGIVESLIRDVDTCYAIFQNLSQLFIAQKNNADVQVHSPSKESLVDAIHKKLRCGVNIEEGAKERTAMECELSLENGKPSSIFVCALALLDIKANPFKNRIVFFLIVKLLQAIAHVLKPVFNDIGTSTASSDPNVAIPDHEKIGVIYRGLTTKSDCSTALEEALLGGRLVLKGNSIQNCLQVVVVHNNQPPSTANRDFFQLSDDYITEIFNLLQKKGKTFDVSKLKIVDAFLTPDNSMKKRKAGGISNTAGENQQVFEDDSDSDSDEDSEGKYGGLFDEDDSEAAINTVFMTKSRWKRYKQGIKS